ncbi:MAG: AAA family ATPase, partial [Solirubrobacterales bacterium]
MTFDRLFDTGEAEGSEPPRPSMDAPLAVRMRPRSLDEVIGQEHVLGAGAALRRAIESGRPHSAILYGPPGAGKTTLARIAAAGAQGAFEEESAVNAGKAEIRGVIERARERRRANGRPTILFLDEIHRFNKAQQDALLPAVEDGTLTLIGATTENPYFEVNSALLSRCQLYQLDPLDEQALGRIVDRGAAVLKATIDPAVRDQIVQSAGGDARNALNILEAAVGVAGDDPVGEQHVRDAARKAPLLYDK